MNERRPLEHISTVSTYHQYVGTTNLQVKNYR
jgi:hypothetical protein